MSKYLFKTKRLGFNLLNEDHYQYLAALDSDAEVRRFFPEGVATAEQIRRRMQEFLTYHKEKGIPVFVIFDLEDDGFVGRAGFSLMDDGEVEVGYVFHKHAWGKGYATETLQALLKWAKKNLDVNRIVAYTVSEHIASFHVMEKCGMKFYKKESVDGIECRFYCIDNK